MLQKRSEILFCYGQEAWLIKKIQNGGVYSRISNKTYNDLRGLYYSDKSQNGFNIIDPYTLFDAEY